MKARVELNIHDDFQVIYESGEFWLTSKTCTGCSQTFSMRFFHRFRFKNKSKLKYEFMDKNKRSGTFVICASCFFEFDNEEMGIKKNIQAELEQQGRSLSFDGK